MHLTGIRKGEIEDVQKKLSDKTGKIVNENLLSTTTAIIKKHFNEKGYLNTTVTIKQRKDPGDANSVILDVKIDKKEKVMITEVILLRAIRPLNQNSCGKYLKKPVPANSITYLARVSLRKINTKRIRKT